MIVGFKHKGLRDLYNRDTQRGIRPDLSRRIKTILVDLNVATSIDDVARPANRLHQLKGDQKGTWSVKVNGPWRITFTYEDGKFGNLDLVQDH